MVGLFNSAASQAILDLPEDAALYEAYYKALLGLNSAAARPTQLRGLRIGKQAAGFLGQNLAKELTPVQADFDRYGIDGGTPTKLAEIARRASSRSGVQAQHHPVDHPPASATTRTTPSATWPRCSHGDQPGKILERSCRPRRQPDPSCSDRKLAESGHHRPRRHPKTPLQRSGWPDGTPGDSNWIYAMGNGYLKTGWHGGVKANGNTDGFDPTTGATVPNQAASATSAAAGAAVAFAIAKGDMRRVQDFYTGPAIDGIVNIDPLQ